MALIAPSILSADFANLQAGVETIAESGADWVHVDVMDGLFVPNITIGIPVVAALRRVTSLPLDVHLMIDRPIRYVEQFCKAGADYLTIHVEADTPENTLAALEKIASFGVKPAISLNPGTPVEAVEPYLDKVAMILVMTVEPGFGGQKFMPAAVEKIAAIRAEAQRRGLSTDIEVDGGIDAATAPLCAAAGANVLVAGSAVFGAKDPAAAMSAIRAACV